MGKNIIHAPVRGSKLTYGWKFMFDVGQLTTENRTILCWTNLSCPTETVTSGKITEFAWHHWKSRRYATDALTLLQPASSLESIHPIRQRDNICGLNPRDFVWGFNSQQVNVPDRWVWYQETETILTITLVHFVFRLFWISMPKDYLGHLIRVNRSRLIPNQHTTNVRML